MPERSGATQRQRLVVGRGFPGRKVPTEKGRMQRDEKRGGLWRGRKKEPEWLARLYLEPSSFVYFRRFVRVAKWVGLIALN